MNLALLSATPPEEGNFGRGARRAGWSLGSDIGQAEALLQLTLEGAQALAADKGYDSDKFVAALEARGMEAIIPPRVNRISPRECDGFAYKERHLIECFFGKIKHYRRIFSLFEKLKRSYMGFL